MKKIIILGSIILSTIQCWAYDIPQPRVALKPETAQAQSGKVTYQFQLVDTQTNKALSDQDLQISHEKQLHLLVYDPSLKEFQHVHPEYNGMLWTVELKFSVNGQYWVWAQGELSSDSQDFSASAHLEITGGLPAWPLPPSLSDMRLGAVGNSQAEIEASKIEAGKMIMLRMKFARTDGTQPQIEPYLGAFAHIVAVPEDGDSLLHVHPMNGTNSTEGMIHMTFPQPGAYRLWIQYIDGGDLKTIPLAIKVF